jgi:hypothetical protein
MTPEQVQIKVALRLNKAASSDYSNIQCFHIREAVNKATLDWTRRQIHGINQKQEGDEESRMRVDDLNVLLKETTINFSDKGEYTETDTLPTDYLWFKRVYIHAKNDTCPDKRLIVAYFIEEANVDLWLNDNNKCPSFEWGETFFTLVGGKIRLYTNQQFVVDTVHLIYYRKPTLFDITDCEHPDGSSGSNVDIEFKDDVAEIIVDEAVAIIGGDIENGAALQTSTQRKELNN